MSAGQDALEPCPFCGTQPSDDLDDVVYPLTRDRSLWQVVCDETAGGCGASVLGDLPEHAIAQWNTRAAPKVNVPREPTQEMCDAAEDVDRSLLPLQFKRAVWRAMYDAALAESAK